MSTTILDVEPEAQDVAPTIEPNSDATSDWDEQSVASSTQSLTESILEHVYENGRRYHRMSKEQYQLPTDETEQDRLDMVHHLHLELLKGNITLTKFDEDPANVIDCGCGTGIWALDFGDIHKGSQVIGLDLAPIQPGWTAPNVKFELDDLEKKWMYPENYFNFVHSRHLVMSIRNWPRYLRQIYKHTAPGGCIELVEHTNDRGFCDDDSIADDSSFPVYWAAVRKCYEKLGMNSGLRAADYICLVEEAGFEDVKVYPFKIPLGPWASNPKMRRLGAICAEIARTGIEAYAFSMLTNVGGHPVEDARKLVNDAIGTLTDPRQHAYYFEYFITARKPESDSA
ncbi:S-adenosyl-L-methionine-dependent methyltransferase [Ascodesmis nigricans]|uniref:S-adenosyl-L-methionine-dependent methyltransferase n=1 Tax=Ascodesmis nigricans TaxID=341454 RepID=A0A4S2MHY6_9PEZI|nr:S-adenosyl-L-methionine-dependent methyltransferase [Ascodesmis nigricans]